jgi:hypothetical protein
VAGDSIGTSKADQKMLRDAYDDDLASYMSHFRDYQTWLDEDARARVFLLLVWMSVWLLILFGLITLFKSLLPQRYEPYGESTYITALRQEQLL